MTSTQLVPAIVAPLIVWRVYVRVRRNIGRQRLEPRALKVRIAVFGLVLLVIAAGAAFFLPGLLALLAGVAGSVALAWAGVRLTKFERTPEGDFFTPNTVIGIALSLLLIGRLVYRLTVVYQHASASGERLPYTMGSPLTLGILGLTFGYYVAYYTGVLVQSRRVA